MRSEIYYNRVSILLLSILVVFSFCFVFVFPQPWPPTGDSLWYLMMAQGESVHAPFSSRILIPFIVGLFPDSIHQQIFSVISTVSMIITCFILFEYLKLEGVRTKTCFIGSIMLMCSEGYWYYLGTTLIDPPFLALWMLFFYFLKKDQVNAIIPLLFVSILVKETTMLMIPLFFIYLYHSKIRFEIRMLYGIIAAGTTGSIFIILRSSFGGVPYSLETVIAALEYHGIGLDNIPVAILLFGLYLTASIVWLFGILGVSPIIGFIQSDRQKKENVLILFIFIIGFILLAADWWRMLLYVLPLYFALSLKSIDTKLKHLDISIENLVYFVLAVLTFIWFLAILVISKILVPTNPLMLKAGISGVFAIATSSIYILKKPLDDISA